MQPRINYKTRLVAFIDVMGFSALLGGKTPNSQLVNYYSKIGEFLGEKSAFYQSFAEEDDFKKMLVSDSIIMSIKINPESPDVINKIALFFSSVSLIQYRLAVECDIWSRGGIAMGNLCIDEDYNILVGPAFVAAYNLEKKANYPRIVIDPTVCKQLNLAPTEFMRRIAFTDKKGTILGKADTRMLDAMGRNFEFDCLQLDWFQYAVTGSAALNLFFDGIHARASTNQDLFEKCQKLGKYLRESFCQNTKDRLVGGSDRTTEIESHLFHAGF